MVADVPQPTGSGATAVWHLPEEVLRWDPDESNPVTRPILGDDC